LLAALYAAFPRLSWPLRFISFDGFTAGFQSIASVPLFTLQGTFPADCAASVLLSFAHFYGMSGARLWFVSFLL